MKGAESPGYLEKEGNPTTPFLGNAFFKWRSSRVQNVMCDGARCCCCVERCILHLRLALTGVRSLGERSATSTRRCSLCNRGRCVFKEWNQVRVLTGRSLGIGRVLADDAIIGRSVRVNLAPGFEQPAPHRAACGTPVGGRPQRVDFGIDRLELDPPRITAGPPRTENGRSVDPRQGFVDEHMHPRFQIFD